MRINHIPETDDLPPPPYTPHDPSVAEDGQDVAIQPTLRGGYMRPSLPSEQSNFSSAATYFEDRQYVLPSDGSLPLNLVEHNITIKPDTTRDDVLFPLPVETYIARDVTNLDWSTLVNHLFPMPNELPKQKSGREKDTKSRSFAEEDTLEGRERIESVIAEWNEKFFNPRLIHVNVDFGRPSSSSSRSTARPTSTLGISPSEMSMHNESVPVETRYTLPPKDNYTARPRHLFRSTSSSSSSSASSSSSSSSSVESIKSKDFEGADISKIRSALLAFRIDIANKDHLRQAVRNLRDEFRSQRRDISFRDLKGLKKEYKDQRKEVKREVKAVIKEVKATRKADRKLRKAEIKSRREGKRAEHRGQHHIRRAHEKSMRAQERAEEKALRAQERGIEAQERAAEKTAKARERAAEGHRRAAAAAAKHRAGEIDEMAQVRARDAQTHGNGGSWGDAGRVKARAAETRAQETARDAGIRDWGSFGRERAREAQETAYNASYQDWSGYGRN